MSSRLISRGKSKYIQSSGLEIQIYNRDIHASAINETEYINSSVEEKEITERERNGSSEEEKRQ